MSDVMMRRDVDNGWAWVALIAAVFILALMASFDTCVGIFQVELLESFPGSQGFLALVCSIAVSGQLLLGPVAGIISDLLTHRIAVMIGGVFLFVGLFSASISHSTISILFLFGIVCGTGFGLCYTATVTVVSTYFHKYRTVANGISLAAPGVGILATPYLLRWLIGDYGWRNAMVIFGCIIAQICVLAAVFFPLGATPSSTCCSSRQKPAHTHGQDVKAKMSTQNGDLKQAHKAESEVMLGSQLVMQVSEFGSVVMSQSMTRSVEHIGSQSLRQRIKHLLLRKFMWVICMNQMLMMAGYASTNILFPAYAQSVGVALKDIPPIYIAYGGTMTVSRIVAGFVFNAIPTHQLKGFFFFQLGYACILTLIPVCGVSFETLLVCKLLIGLTYGPSILLLTPILVHHVGLRDLPVAFGVVMLSSGLGAIVAPPIAGLMYDITDNYGVCYFIAGPTVGVAALSLLLLLFIDDLQPSDDAMVTKKPYNLPPEEVVVTKEMLLLANQNDSYTTSLEDPRVTMEALLSTNQKELDRSSPETVHKQMSENDINKPESVAM